MNKIKWKTDIRKIGDLKTFKGNPRVLKDKAHKELSESIDKFDLVEIPVINTDNSIIAGNQRVTILKEMYGPEHEIEVRIPDRLLTIDECKEYLLRSNKNTGDWDFDILIDEFDTDMLLDVGFTAKDLEESSSDVDTKIDADEEFDFTVKGMELTNFESYDYIVLMFDNVSDYLSVCQKLNITGNTTARLSKGVRKTGFGRAIDGRRIIDRIKE